MSSSAIGHTCPWCGATEAQPADIDSWWCPTCKREFATTAFKCKHAGCWEPTFIADYCERHKADARLPPPAPPGTTQ